MGSPKSLPAGESSDLTGALKSALWKYYGDRANPAEWDGHVYGGGKLSQRFWEYYEAIELLDLSKDSVVLDIGGGSPEVGAGFFARLIAPHVKQVHVIDLNVGHAINLPSNIVLHQTLADYDRTLQVLNQYPDITHISCISVFEHIDHGMRCGIVKAINEGFRGGVFVATVEYHPKHRYFEEQLTTRTLSELFTPLTRFYPDDIRKSPFWCENAFVTPSALYWRLAKLGLRLKRLQSTAQIALWYPVALRFRQA